MSHGPCGRGGAAWRDPVIVNVAAIRVTACASLCVLVFMFVPQFPLIPTSGVLSGPQRIHRSQPGDSLRQIGSIARTVVPVRMFSNVCRIPLGQTNSIDL